MKLLDEKIKSKLATSKGFIIDGYPREKKQGEEFEAAVSLMVLYIYNRSIVHSICFNTHIRHIRLTS